MRSNTQNYTYKFQSEPLGDFFSFFPKVTEMAELLRLYKYMYEILLTCMI